MISFFKCGEQGHLAGLHTKKKRNSEYPNNGAKTAGKSDEYDKKKKKK